MFSRVASPLLNKHSKHLCIAARISTLLKKSRKEARRIPAPPDKESSHLTLAIKAQLPTIFVPTRRSLEIPTIWTSAASWEGHQQHLPTSSSNSRQKSVWLRKAQLQHHRQQQQQQLIWLNNNWITTTTKIFLNYRAPANRNKTEPR